MAKRMMGCDVLGEIRKSQRALRRAERWLMQCERDAKRQAAKDRERFEARQKEIAARKEREARTVGSMKRALESENPAPQ